MIGWYVHAHGAGHRTRLAAVSARLRTPVTALSSGPRPSGFDGGWVDLPDDLPRPGGERDVTAGGALHWAPLHSPGLRDRAAAVAAWVAAARPSLFVVDVSVEIAVLVRAMGVPVVVVAMRGDRSDRPHRTAYDLADALLAPWPEGSPEPWPDAWHDRTWHVGGLSRFDGRPTGPPPGRRRVAVLWGSGGSDVTGAQVRSAAAATPDWTWTVAGLDAPPVADVWDLLQEADVVVTHGGQNAVAEVAAARRPAIVVPQSRPYGEQVATGRALAGADLAQVLTAWPADAHWPDLLRRAAAQDGSAWRAWSDGAGAARAAALLDERAEVHACASR